MGTATMTLDEARGLLGEGKRLRVTVGSGADDPVVVLSLSDGTVMCESVAGWSAGVVEPACSVESDYLATYLDKSIEVLEPGDSGWRAGL
jgi:hypothetical protein